LLSVNRAALGALVFDPLHGPARLAKLNALVWPPLLALLVADLAALKKRPQGCPVAVVEAAVLVEAGWHDAVCDETWLVLADAPVALKRLQARNPSLADAAAAARLAAAPPAKGRLPHVQGIVVNNAAWPGDASSSGAAAAAAGSGVGVGSGLDAALLPLLAAARARATDPAMRLANRPRDECPLAHRWRTLCARLAAAAPGRPARDDATPLSTGAARPDPLEGVGLPLPAWAAPWWRKLRDRYTHPGRRYHTLAHVRAVLATLDALQPEQPDLTALAAFFHDAVYDPTAPSGDNERASAALFREFAAAVGVGAEGLGAGTVASSSHRISGEGGTGLWAAGAAAAVAAWIERTASHLPPAGSDATATPTGDLAKFLDADLAVLGASGAAYARYALQVRLEYHAHGDAAFRSGRAQVLRGFLSAPSLYSTPDAQRALEPQARRNLAAEIQRLEA
jgi:predicted metal-dependent HD superfamily phosphohydrolase